MIATAILLSPTDRTYSIVTHSDGLRLRSASRANGFGLDQPEFPLPLSSLARSATGSDKGAVEQVRSHWSIGADPDRATSFGPTVGQGWTLLAYPDAISRRWIGLLNLSWMLFLMVPVGFWARGRMLSLAAATIAILLVLVPVTTGIAPTSSGEWAGAAIGLLFGAALGTLSFAPARHELTRL
jgi:hypothetical protein